MISQGLCSFYLKTQIPSDIDSEHNQFLPHENLKTQANLNEISKWTNKNLTQLNTHKSNYMIINFTEKYQFSTRLSLENKPIEQVSQDSLLGVVINDRLTWESNTEFIVKKAYKKMRMIILQNLFKFGLPVVELIHIYILYIRSVVENSAVVWHSSLTVADSLSIERIQKVALKIILNDNYEDYTQALMVTGLPTLKQRRITLCKKFAVKCVKNEKTSHMFPLSQHNIANTRHHEKFFVQPARTERLKNSAIPYMQRLLNSI